VRSVLGRFLEHSRVYYFHDHGQHQLWLSSADIMERNMFRRVEVAVPVYSQPNKDRILKEIFEVNLAENVRVWELQTDGNYLLRHSAHAENPQDILLNLKKTSIHTS
jgi:polyphosphate kinase